MPKAPQRNICGHSGKQEQFKRPSAHKRDIVPPDPCLMWWQQNWSRIKSGPRLIRFRRPLSLGQDRSLAMNRRWLSPSGITPASTTVPHVSTLRLAVGGGWRLVAVGGWWRLAVGGGWWLVVGGWWSLGGGPQGRSLTKKKILVPKRTPLAATHMVLVVQQGRHKWVMQSRKTVAWTKGAGVTHGPARQCANRAARACQGEGRSTSCDTEDWGF